MLMIRRCVQCRVLQNSGCGNARLHMQFEFAMQGRSTIESVPAFDRNAARYITPTSCTHLREGVAIALVHAGGWRKAARQQSAATCGGRRFAIGWKPRGISRRE